MKTLLSCLFFGFSALVYANEDSTLNVDMHNPSFAITLPANPTTGFQWSVVHFDKKLLILSASHYERPKTNLMGAGGHMDFTFMLQKEKSYPASTEIVFKYARAWEAKSATVKKIKVNFVKNTGNNQP